jgi:gliding motility-associated-like protein
MRKAIFILFLVLAFSVDAQVTFHKQFGIWNESSMNNFQQTSDGGYILCTDAVFEMDTLSSTPSAYGYLIKMDANGNVTWQKRFQKSNIAAKGSDGNSVFQTADDGYVVATTFIDSTTIRILVIKTDAMGNIQWSATYPGAGNSSACCIRQCPDLGYILAGTTSEPVSTDAYLLKIDNSGVVQWGKKFTSPAGYVTLQTVDVLPGSGYMAVGYSSDGAVVLKTDLNGNEQWNKSFFSEGSYFTSLARISSSNYICSGNLYYADTISYLQGLLAGVDTSGNMIWAKHTNSEGGFYDIKKTNDNSVIVSGIAGDATFNSSSYLMKFDLNGNNLWAHNFGYAVLPHSCVDATSDDGFAMFFPDLSSIGWNNWTVNVIKTDNLGNLSCFNSDTAIVTNNVSPFFINNASFTNATPWLPKTVIMSTCAVSHADPCLPEVHPEEDCLFIPNTFSPNGDSNNDLFKIGYCGSDTYLIRIYNRWGEQQFTTSDPTHYWNGKNVHRQDASDGTYYYVLDIGAKEYKGFISLIR